MNNRPGKRGTFYSAASQLGRGALPSRTFFMTTSVSDVEAFVDPVSIKFSDGSSAGAAGTACPVETRGFLGKVLLFSRNHTQLRKSGMWEQLGGDNPLIYLKSACLFTDALAVTKVPSVLVLVQDLADDLSSELSGNFRSVVLGLLMLAPVYDSHELRNAIKVLMISSYKVPNSGFVFFYS